MCRRAGMCTEILPLLRSAAASGGIFTHHGWLRFADNAAAVILIVSFLRTYECSYSTP